MNRSSPRLLATVSTFLGLLAVAGLPTVAIGATTHPTVYELHHPGPVGITQSSNPQAFAPLTVPAGRWVAWARLNVFTDGNIRRVRCTLNASNGSSARPAAAAQPGYVTTLTNELDTIDLSASLSSPLDDVTFSLRCRDESLTLPTAAPHAEAIRMVAMRLSSLTQTEIGDLNTADAGAVRTTAPAQLIHGYRNSDIAIPESSTSKTVANLPLEAGLWSIRASFSVASVNGESREPANSGHCRIMLGTNGPGRVLTTGDKVVLNVGNPGAEEDRQAYYLDTAGKLSEPGGLRLQCWQTQGSGDLVVRRLRITALRLGSLRIGSAETGDPSVSYGRDNLPHARHARTHDPFVISGDGGLDEVVGRLKLPAGRWLVFAKVSYDGADISCSLEVGFDAGVGTSDIVGEELSLHVVGLLDAPTVVKLTCDNFITDEPIELSYVHITAVRVKHPFD